MIDVFLKDGRTVFRLPSRATMVELLKVDPFVIDDEPFAPKVGAWALWNRVDDPSEWRPTNLLFLASGSIAFVRAVEADEAELFGELAMAQLSEAVA